MPSTIVRIEWDSPEDPNWLNRFNIEIALAAYCKNTAFEVTDASDLLAALGAFKEAEYSADERGLKHPITVGLLSKASGLSRIAIAKAKGEET